MVEFSAREKKIFDIFSSKEEICVAPTVGEKKVIWFVTQKCILKNFQKQQLCICDGWR